RTVGTIVAVAASKAGDISQDLKTGFLVGATPAKQQLGQLIGAAFACWAVAGTVLLLGNTYTFGDKEIPAPQAVLMKTIIEGVLAGSLPWGLVLTGGGLSIAAMLCGAWAPSRTPSTPAARRARARAIPAFSPPPVWWPARASPEFWWPRWWRWASLRRACRRGSAECRASSRRRGCFSCSATSSGAPRDGEPPEPYGS